MTIFLSPKSPFPFIYFYLCSCLSTHYYPPSSIPPPPPFIYISPQNIASPFLLMSCQPSVYSHNEFFLLCSSWSHPLYSVWYDTLAPILYVFYDPIYSDLITLVSYDLIWFNPIRSSLLCSLHSNPICSFVLPYSALSALLLGTSNLVLNNVALSYILPSSIMYYKIEVINLINIDYCNHYHAPVVDCWECWEFLVDRKFENLVNPDLDNLNNLQNLVHFSLTLHGNISTLCCYYKVWSCYIWSFYNMEQFKIFFKMKILVYA